jgi:predicted Zn-dependent peptidase
MLKVDKFLNGNQPPINPDLLEFYFPDVKEIQLANGLHVLIVERNDLPKIYLRLGLNVGTKNDPADRAGLLQLLANTMKKGTQSKKYSEIIQIIEQVGGDLDTSVNEDFFVIHGEFLKHHIRTGIEIVCDVALHPSFPAGELEKERFKLVADLENEKSSPDFLAQRRVHHALFAPHPYGSYKTQTSLQRINRSDLQDIHEEYFSPQNSFLVIAGDITKNEAEKLATEFLGKWMQNLADQAGRKSPASLTQPIIQFVHRPASEQSHILIGNILFPRKHPDFEKMTVMNKILGGGGSGRLFMNLREEKGYTYGAYSTLLTRKDTGAFVANAEVRTEVTLPAIEAFHQEFNRIRDEKVSPEELKNAKQFLRGIFPLQNETPASIAALALRQRLFELDENYWNRYLQTIGDVTETDVQETASQFLPDNKYVTVIVGDADRLLSSLEPLGEIAVFDLEDNEVT